MAIQIASGFLLLSLTILASGLGPAPQNCVAVWPEENSGGHACTTSGVLDDVQSDLGNAASLLQRKATGTSLTEPAGNVQREAPKDVDREKPSLMQLASLDDLALGSGNPQGEEIVTAILALQLPTPEAALRRMCNEDEDRLQLQALNSPHVIVLPQQRGETGDEDEVFPDLEEDERAISIPSLPVASLRTKSVSCNEALKQCNAFIRKAMASPDFYYDDDEKELRADLEVRLAICLYSSEQLYRNFNRYLRLGTFKLAERYFLFARWLAWAMTRTAQFSPAKPVYNAPRGASNAEKAAELVALRTKPDVLFRGVSVNLCSSDIVTGTYEVGTTFTSWFFESSSSSFSEALGFADRKDKPQGTVFYITGAKKGADVRDVSKYPKEEEKLFYPGTQYTVYYISEDPRCIIWLVVDKHRVDRRLQVRPARIVEAVKVDEPRPKFVQAKPSKLARGPLEIARQRIRVRGRRAGAVRGGRPTFWRGADPLAERTAGGAIGSQRRKADAESRLLDDNLQDLDEESRAFPEDFEDGGDEEDSDSRMIDTNLEDSDSRLLDTALEER